jgi:glycosyltransferase involved in cell wall biosynthesis
VQLRCRNFADAINRIGWQCANLLDLDSFVQNTPEARQLCDESDLLVIHRYLYGPVLRAIEYWKARDKKVIVDFDHAINHLSPDIPGSAFWLQGERCEYKANGEKFLSSPVDSTRLEQFKWGLGLIDAATVSSTRLLIDWSAFTEIYEIPDYLNTDQYPAFKQVHENEIWVGLADHARLASIKNSGLLKALENVCQSHPQVKLVLPDREYQTELTIDPSQFVLYPANIFQEWADILLKLDVGVIPIHGDYDLRLGRIHLLEFMISKTPWIASNQACLREFNRYGKLVENSPGAWEAALLRIIDHIDIMQKRAAGEPFLFALSQDVHENIDKVLRLYTHILAQPQGSGTR